MGPKATPSCGLCSQPSKYRCSACPVRYCSVACYKKHKETCVATTAAATASAPSLEPASAPATSEQAAAPPFDAPKADPLAPAVDAPPPPLRALAGLRWPPEPDASVFQDPLKRDDPKPLRHAELERIATSAPLRELLTHPALTKVLAALDALPTPNARHASLARLLGVDGTSLAKPAAAALLHRSGSPPPLQDLLGGGGAQSTAADDWGSDGWWLGRDDARVWIGPEERRLMRLWAGVVVQAVDDDGDGAWGAADGDLEWEV
ncbi:uncharacterized protein EHS24_006882 [Apiotrichum porosum]|uniref:HIT-type domain-containing protein n=1 Tax=Apiotrichum porosum TaxID=105984 RepID=A0A427XWW6_9TREE|nr:uncharacterized protein EHS24_006882 [Apiotrichum porosum]RSH83215.1 hypothetical protein EHS24_006882 [Apiotrichum porosum]